MESLHLMVVAVVGMLSVTTLVALALRLGVNGVMLGAAVGLICTIVGYAFGVRKAGK